MEINLIQKKLIRGFLSLSFRKILLDAINFVTIFIILAKVLPVPIIGIYAIAQTILSFFTYFSDIGLGAALIQKKQISKDDLRTTFTIQECLILILTGVIWFAAPYFASFYKFDDSSMWLIRALAIGFFLNSLKVIPSTILERDLKFEPIVFVEIIETLLFNGLLIYLSFNNMGVAAYSYAVLIRGAVGALLINILAPWKMSLGFSRDSARTLINFGIPFQLNSILALLKDRLTPLITSQIVGVYGMGYLSWAQGIAFRPLEVMNIIIRITFPAFSRLQDNDKALKNIVERSLFLTVLFLYPLLFGILAIIPNFIDFMGKEKWQPATPLIYLFAFSTFWAAPSTTFTNVLNAVGKVGITLKLMIMWTVLTWILSPILAVYYGYTGVAFASAIISFTSVIPIIIVTKLLKIEVISNIWQPLISSLLMAILVYFVSLYLDKNIYTLIALVSFGVIIYLVSIGLFAKQKILLSLRELKDV